jgi:UDP:flavonoid glycosyltransferase YjiC (YdhE family)
LIGPVIDVKPDQLPDQTELKRKLGFDPSKPLIHCSVSGSKFERAYFANKLTHILSRLPDKYQAVLSRGDFEGSSRPERRNNLLVYNWIENQHEYYKACDLVVSRAGHGTILKSLTYGKPLILIPIPEHTEQYGNARRAAQLKLAKVINQNQLSRESFLNAVEEILQSDGYSRRALQVSEMTRSLDAVETAAKIIMSVT